MTPLFGPPWWRHQMETFSALLALFAGNSRAPYKGQWQGALMFYLLCAWTNGSVNYRDMGELRCHCAHYDITVMIIPYTKLIFNTLIEASMIHPTIQHFMYLICIWYCHPSHHEIDYGQSWHTFSLLLGTEFSDLFSLNFSRPEVTQFSQWYFFMYVIDMTSISVLNHYLNHCFIWLNWSEYIYRVW